MKLVLIILLYFGWSQWDKKAPQLPADTMIRIERTDCFYTCQAYVVRASFGELRGRAAENARSMLVQELNFDMTARESAVYYESNRLKLERTGQ